MHTRQVNLTRGVPLDIIHVDSSLSCDGRNATATTMKISGGPPWGPQDPPLTLTASVAFFALADIGNEIVLRATTVVAGVTVIDEIRL